MKRIFLIILSIGIALGLTGGVVFAEDYASMTPEEIESEINRLEGQLEILYKLREEANSESNDSTPQSENDTAKVLTYTGNGDSVVSIESYGDWHYYEIEGNQSSKYFGVIAYTEDGDRIGSLVNTTDVYHGAVYDDTQSAAVLEVKATGDWKIEIKSLYTATPATKGDTVSGSGDDVIVFYTDNGESVTASIEGNAVGGYFGVIGYDGNGSRTGSLVNTTEKYNGQVMIRKGTRIFEVKAVDAWKITFD